jgi:hypothetical protein
LDLREDAALREEEDCRLDWPDIPAWRATRNNNETTNNERRTATD